MFSMISAMAPLVLRSKPMAKPSLVCTPKKKLANKVLKIFREHNKSIISSVKGQFPWKTEDKISLIPLPVKKSGARKPPVKSSEIDIIMSANFP